VNNKVHSAMKILPFIVNYEREMRMGANIRRKGKVEKVTVHRKNKESTGGSRSYIKEGSRRNEKASG